MMPGHASVLFDLLSADSEPEFSFYSHVVEVVVRQPSEISSLLEDYDEDLILGHVAANAVRLTQIFELVYPQTALPSSKSRIGVETGNLLNSLLGHLVELLDPNTLTSLLISALRLCLPTKSLVLRNLATTLAKNERLLITLVSNPQGYEIARDWTNSAKTTIASPLTLKLWTSVLMQAVDHCAGDHGKAALLQRWNSLVKLQLKLKALESEYHEKVAETLRATAKKGLPSLSIMRKLEDKDRRAMSAKPLGEMESVIDIDPVLQGLLGEFNMPLPLSSGQVEQQMQRAEVEEVSTVLCAVIESFPCKLCYERGLPNHAQTPFIEPKCFAREETSTTELRKDVLGKPIGEWKVLLSGQAVASMHKHNTSGSFGLINAKLTDLANGIWAYRIAGSGAQRTRLKVPLAITKCGKNEQILWQIDVGEIPESGNLQQVVKVWAIGRDTEITRAIDNVVVLQSRCSDEVISICRQRPSKLKDRFVPTLLPRAEQLGKSHSSMRMINIDAVDRDVVEMANKFYALTEPLIRSVLANDLMAELPFDLSADETLIINHFETASMILSRSGTGKTTCLVFKLVVKYLTRSKTAGERALRQVLLTRSTFLAEKLRNYTRRLIETLSSKVAGVARLSEDEDMPHDTFGESTTLKTVLDLKDESFPLICTYDQFLEILENTVRAMNRKDFDATSTKLSASKRVSNTTQLAKAVSIHKHAQPVVDFYTFKVDYWPRFPEHLTKKLSLALVFAEIMGVIKGSNTSGASLAPLSREEYQKQSCRLAPNFTLGPDRTRVYDVFELYEELKHERKDIDNVDRVLSLLGALKEDSNLMHHLGLAFDEVYIDEVQDQRCIDIELLLNIVKDARGFHFAGDTAQAISQDSTFRFSDVKASFYAHFSGTGSSTRQRQLARPALFTLSKNYRSHQGILGLASLVMDLLWKGFPETLDKLEPEVGQLRGPSPILFLGCNSNILVSSNVGLVDLSEHAADFGAEQVILVRDEESRAKLHAQIGDVALILTILQSKGMEFEDVILWDFFTSSPCASGLRKLELLLKDDGKQFDATINAGICSELKHLYVAITRARMRLIMIESSKNAASPIAKLFTECNPVPLVDVTCPENKNFDEKLKNLRAGSSVDPKKWAQRGEELMRSKSYEEARFCFRKANEPRKEMIANAHVLEGTGRRLASENDVEKSTELFEAAVKAFLEVQLISDSCRILIRLGNHEGAGELWFADQKYGKAAPLFEAAGLLDKASKCYTFNGQHNEAAEALLKGKLFDQLLAYLKDNRDFMEVVHYRRYARLCKLLLKQGKISTRYRKLAIDLLGTAAEQESFFQEYEMQDELVELYRKQKRFSDLFSLFEEAGQIEKALNVARVHHLQCSSMAISEARIMKALDYFWAARFAETHEPDLDTLTAIRCEEIDQQAPSLVKRNEEWKTGYEVFHHFQGPEVLVKVVDMKDSLVKGFLSSHIAMNQMSATLLADVHPVPIKLIKIAIETIKNALSDRSTPLPPLFQLLTGIFSNSGESKECIVLPWSPLRKSANFSVYNHQELPSLARSLVLEKLGTTMLALEDVMRTGLRSKYPDRCLQYLANNHCERELCRRAHTLPTLVSHVQMIQDLMNIADLIFQLSVLYYRCYKRMGDTQFGRGYLGVKRYWLEKLIRELTFLSSYQQPASVLTRARAEIRIGKDAAMVKASLEEFLFWRLNNEWQQRNDFSSLLEQSQFAQHLGRVVERRFLKALSYKLRSFSDELAVAQLRILRDLQDDKLQPNAERFKLKLQDFLTRLDSAKGHHFQSLHAIASAVEYLICYLLVQTSPTLILPQSWTSLYLQSIIEAKVADTEPSSWSETESYKQCLVDLLLSFCRIISKIYSSPDFAFNQSIAHLWYFKQIAPRRIAQSLNIAILNMACSRALPRGFVAMCAELKQLLNLPLMRTAHLQYRSFDDLARLLFKVLSRYEDRDSLILVTKSSSLQHPIHRTLRDLGAKWFTMDQLRPDALKLPCRPLDDSNRGVGVVRDEQYTDAEISAITTIQRFWRVQLPKFQDHHEYMKTAEAQIVAHFIGLAEAVKLKLPVRHALPLMAVLMSQGVHVKLQLDDAYEMVEKIRKRILSLLTDKSTDINTCEHLDGILEHLNQSIAAVNGARAQMFGKEMQELLEQGDLHKTRSLMKVAVGVVKDAHDQAKLATTATNSLN